MRFQRILLRARTRSLNKAEDRFWPEAAEMRRFLLRRGLGRHPVGLVSGRRRRPMKSLPPSAAQTGHTVFPYPAFMKGKCGINRHRFNRPEKLPRNSGLNPHCTEGQAPRQTQHKVWTDATIDGPARWATAVNLRATVPPIKRDSISASGYCRFLRALVVLAFAITSFSLA